MKKIDKITEFYTIIEKIGITKFILSLIISYIMLIISPNSIIKLFAEKISSELIYQALTVFIFYFLVILLLYDILKSKITKFLIFKQKEKDYYKIIDYINENFSKGSIDILKKYFNKEVNQFISNIDLIPSDKNVEALKKLGVLHYNGPWTYYNNNEYDHILNQKYLDSLNYYYRKTGKIVIK